jgi:hypothetical protein
MEKKQKENRSLPTTIRERVYLYASLRPGDQSSWRKLEKEPGQLPTGRIVGSVEIVDCKQTSTGGYAYLLARPKENPPAFSCKESAPASFLETKVLNVGQRTKKLYFVVEPR